MSLGSWLYVAYPYKAHVVPTLHALCQITGVSCCNVSLMRHEWSPSFRLVVRDKWVKVLYSVVHRTYRGRVPRFQDM